ncbi:MAG: pyridoxamine 5'-phosphate oxidase family protein [Pseudomonadota bacterium]
MALPIGAMANELNRVFDTIVSRLVRAGSDRRSPWRLPVLATLCPDRGPQARTLVLRAVDAEPLSLDFYTDQRTPKTAEIAADPRVSLAFWDKGASQQLRLEGLAALHTTGAAVDQARERLAGYTGSDYARWAVPGAPMDTPDAADRRLEDGVAHFALLRVTASRLDWLELARERHRRAIFTRDIGAETGWAGTWAVP